MPKGVESLAALTAAICCIRILEDKPWLWDSGQQDLGKGPEGARVSGAKQEPAQRPVPIKGLKGQAERHRLVPEGP